MPACSAGEIFETSQPVKDLGEAIRYFETAVAKARALRVRRGGRAAACAAADTDPHATVLRLAICARGIVAGARACGAHRPPDLLPRPVSYPAWSVATGAAGRAKTVSERSMHPDCNAVSQRRPGPTSRWGTRSPECPPRLARCAARLRPLTAATPTLLSRHAEPVALPPESAGEGRL